MAAAASVPSWLSTSVLMPSARFVIAETAASDLGRVLRHFVEDLA